MNYIIIHNFKIEEKKKRAMGLTELGLDSAKRALGLFFGSVHTIIPSLNPKSAHIEGHSLIGAYSEFAAYNHQHPLLVYAVRRRHGKYRTLIFFLVYCLLCFILFCFWKWNNGWKLEFEYDVDVGYAWKLRVALWHIVFIIRNLI